MFIVDLCIEAKQKGKIWEQVKYPWIRELSNKLWFIHAMGHGKRHHGGDLCHSFCLRFSPKAIRISSV